MKSLLAEIGWYARHPFTTARWVFRRFVVQWFNGQHEARHRLNKQLEINQQVIEALGQLDGSTAKSVGLLAGLTPEELDKLGGVED